MISTLLFNSECGLTHVVYQEKYEAYFQKGQSLYTRIEALIDQSPRKL